jgi:hypothetical protein
MDGVVQLAGFAVMILDKVKVLCSLAKHLFFKSPDSGRYRRARHVATSRGRSIFGGRVSYTHRQIMDIYQTKGRLTLKSYDIQRHPMNRRIGGSPK